jgi:serine O-acetyltransferase
MTDKTIELINIFNPETVDIPLNKCELEEAVEAIYTCMFPVCECDGITKVRKNLYNALQILHRNISNRADESTADSVVESFMECLPKIRHRLLKDAQCYLASDPAAKSIEEVILTYPGFFALSIHRLAHQLHILGKPLIARYFSEYAHSKVGIDIHPAAKIGKNLFMDHGTGIVIGETCEIGDNVKIYQGVTLGALYVEKKLSDIKRHPTVEDNVVIYANATILGGKTVVGHDSIIGGGAWLTKSVIPYSKVYNSVDVKIRTARDFDNTYDYVI